MEQKINKFIYWTPRVLSITFLFFMALMSLDVFSPGLSAGQIALGLLMHNIPVFILAAVLWISWKREIVGGVIFTLAGAFYVVMTLIQMLRTSAWYMMSWNVTVAGPAFLIGILFIINWFKKQRP